jgi:hypothetical protein
LHDQRVDWLQHSLGKLPPVELPLQHTFTPGLYTRTLTMPKGTVVVSRVHKTEHPFVVSQGRAAVWSQEHGVQEIKAPFVGVTKPGTRRVLFIHEDCIWSTFHPTPETDLDKLQAELTETPDVNYIDAMPESFLKLIGVVR